MKRTKKKSKLSVDAILTADWHLREGNPTCRLDDFESAQWDKVRQVSALQKKHECPVFHAGDLFDHWKPSPRLLSLTARHLPNNFVSVYGNHDLPQHSLDLKEKSGLYNLITNKKVFRNIQEPDTDLGFDSIKINVKGRHILMAHVYVYSGKPPYPGAELEAEGNWLLDSYPALDLLVTGDNHIPFICLDEGRVLVNSGSLTRQTAGQIKHRPRVYLYNAEKNKVKAHYLDIAPGSEVISRGHIEEREQRDERISAFVERLSSEWEADLDFNENIRRFEKENEIDKNVMNIVYQALEE